MRREPKPSHQMPPELPKPIQISSYLCLRARSGSYTLAKATIGVHPYTGYWKLEAMHDLSLEYTGASILKILSSAHALSAAGDVARHPPACHGVLPVVVQL